MRIRIGVVALLLAACSGSAAITPGIQPSATEAAPAMPTTSPSAARPAVSARPSLPVPAAFPVFPGAAQMDPPRTDIAAIAEWWVWADPPQVYDFYLEALPAAGFTISRALPGGDAAAIRLVAPGGDAYQLDLLGHDPVRVLLGPPHD